MLTPNTLLRMIYDAQRKKNIDHLEFAEKSGVSVSRWRDLRTGKTKLRLEELPALAKAVGLSFQVVAPQHEPFMNLTEEEVKALISLAEHYKKNGPQQKHPLRSAVEKLTNSA